MYYEGSTTNKITIGRDMGWGAICSLQIGIAGKFKLGSGTTDYTLIGTRRSSMLSLLVASFPAPPHCRHTPPAGYIYIYYILFL
jgi:hypothetical protein